MQELVSLVLEQLERREAPAPAILARLGESDPADAAEALLRSASLPELAGSLETWGPALLLSAQPGRGAARLADLTVQLRANGAAAIDPTQLPALAALLGTGEVLAEWLRQRPDWAGSLVGKLADEAKPPPPVWDEIRDAHMLGLLRVAAGELQGAPLRKSFERISDLVDGCLAAALECASGETGIAPPGVFAWGRYGAREPGISCALELLLVDAEPSAGIERERASECEHLVERLLEELPHGFEAGLTYSMGPAISGDALTPQACVQPLSTALAMWRMRSECAQRAPLLSLRQLGGSASLGEEFCGAISKLLEQHTGGRKQLQQAANSRTRRRVEIADFELCDEDLLAGPSGMATVERLVRELQLENGQRMDGSVTAALQTLERKQLLDEPIARRLTGAYGWLRRAEHALGLLGSASPLLPRDAEGQVAVARTMGYQDPDAARALARFLYDWRAVRDEIAESSQVVRASDRD